MKEAVSCNLDRIQPTINSRASPTGGRLLRLAGGGRGRRRRQRRGDEGGVQGVRRRRLHLRRRAADRAQEARPPRGQQHGQRQGDDLQRRPRQRRPRRLQRVQVHDEGDHSLGSTMIVRVPHA
jgi:hypothetical protein